MKKTILFTIVTSVISPSFAMETPNNSSVKYYEKQKNLLKKQLANGNGNKANIQTKLNAITKQLGGLQSPKPPVMPVSVPKAPVVYI